MAKLLEYTLSLNDKISEKLQKIAITSDTALNVYAKLEKQTHTVNKVMGDMGKSVGSLQQKLALLRQERDWIPASNIETIRAYNREIKAIEKEITRLQTINGSKIKTWFKDAFAQMPGAGFVTNPLVAATAGLGVITKLGMDAEQTNVAFEVLLGNQQKASEMLAQMNKYAAATPYQKSDIQEAAKTMLGFGIAQEKIMPNLQMLGDIAMGDKAKLQSLTLAFSQIQSTGRLTGQDLLQLINAGFNPLQELSKKTGLSIAELKEQMEKGQISAQMVEEAFRSATSEGGLFYKMTEKIGQTLGGKLSTLMDNLKETALRLFEVIGPILTTALDVLNNVLSVLVVPIHYIVDGLKWLIDKIKDGNPVIVSLIAGITTLSIAMSAATIKINIINKATKLWTTAQAALNLVLNANPIILIITGIVTLITVVVLAYNKISWFRGIINATWEVLRGFGKMLYTMIIGRIIDMIKGIGALGQALYKVFKGDFKGALESAKEAVTKITGVDTMKKVVGQAKEMGQNAAMAYQKGYNEIEHKKAKAGLKSSPIVALNNPLGNISKTNSINPSSVVANSGTRTEGSRNNNTISINIKNLVENIVLNGTLADNKDSIKRQVEETLLRALYAAQSAS